jgi:SAM-dependent methyltransferase
MDLEKLQEALQKPALYVKGDQVMWTDEHISGKLLEIHLDPGQDLASRTPESIGRTVDFLLGFCGESSRSILDLGCGPGLYLERLAGHGHMVSGMDFSQNSIDYAKARAREFRLDIEYLCQDYLKLDDQDRFDLIIMIYTDFGVLLPDERSRLLANVLRALRPGGSFVFDVLNDRNVEQKFQEEQRWTFEKEGFWRPGPYLELTSGYPYPEAKVFMNQHLIMDAGGEFDTYRFWTHYFSHADIRKILSAAGFERIKSHENILPASHAWSGENVTFYSAVKPEN